MNPVDIFKKYQDQILAVREAGQLRSSGFAVEPGIVVTVSHPLQYPDQITVENSRGEKYSAQVIGWDNRYDLAVLSAEDIKEAIPAETIENIQPGLQTYSMGFDSHGPRIHEGMVAQMLESKNISLGGTLTPSIEVNGNLNAAMSGGFLINSEGKILGMNSNMPRGSGMTVEIHQLKALSDEIRRNGTAKPAYIGVSAEPSDDSDGLLITDVEADAPADIAGIENGDLLTAFNGEKLVHPRELFLILRGLVAGQTVVAEVMRGSKRLEVKITLGER